MPSPKLFRPSPFPSTTMRYGAPGTLVHIGRESGGPTMQVGHRPHPRKTGPMPLTGRGTTLRTSLSNVRLYKCGKRFSGLENTPTITTEVAENQAHKTARVVPETGWLRKVRVL